MMSSKRMVLASVLLFFLVLSGPVSAQDAPAAPTLGTAQNSDEVQIPVVPAGSKLDMRAAVQRGLDANPAILAARHELLGSESGRKSALADFFPTASSGYGWVHNDRTPRQFGQRAGDQDSWAFQLNVSQPLFTGFRLLSTYQKARLAKEQNEYKLFQAELSLIQSIQDAFLSLLQGRMDVKSALDSVERLKSQLQVTQAFYDVGLKPRLDVLQAEVQLATAQQELLKAQNAVANQVANLNTLLNMPLEAGVEYVGDLVDYAPFTRSLEDCLSQAYKGRPDLRIGEKSVEMAEKDAKVTASGYYPQFSADYNYNRAGDDPLTGESKYLSNANRESWDVGVNMEWKMWQWGSTYYAHDKSLETVKQIRADLDKTRLDAGFQVKNGLLNMQTAADRIGVARKSVEAARESYRMALARYQAQVGTNTDLLTAQSDVTKSEAELNGALADYAKALSSLYVSMGQKNPGLTP